MRRAIFDIEADNLLTTARKVHCLSILDLQTGDVHGFGPSDIAEGLNLLASYDRIIGHNCILFDMPVLRRLLGFSHPDVHDTIVLSRLLYPDRYTHPAGGNSLSDWGDFLGVAKGESPTDWSTFTWDMLKYNMQDVRVTAAVYRHLGSRATGFSRSYDLEVKVARVIADQLDNGFGFDEQGASLLMAQLQSDMATNQAALQESFPPKEIKLKTKVKYEPFNPSSRQQFAERMTQRHGWEPEVLTDGGKPKIDESVLADMPWPEARLMEKHLLLEKRIAQIRQWLDNTVDGRVHGSVNTNGCVSGRMSHSDPNMAQVPAVGSPYGKECRSLFRPTRSGWKQVGIDASGLELRMFAHYLAEWDSGAYARTVTTGDIHSHNQRMAGLPTRDQAKTFIYGTLYGAGDAKVGKIVNGSAAQGKKLKEQFEKGVPAFAKLKERLKYEVAAKGHLVGLDGRSLPVRSDHMALNLLLQSAGAVIMKQALIHFHGILEDRYANRYGIMANIHDEWQVECEPEIAEEVGKAAVSCIVRAGQELTPGCPLDGAYRVGNNWAECH
jgi:DNA polymerase I-like protein with 3'-5' exonuclease and polymerase domains